MKITYRPEIDGLRAIAVGAVILYHSQITIFGYQPFKGGFIGVDIFFVISGYLITSIILKELVTTGSFSFKYFYERRTRRILPALIFVMLVSLPFAWMYLLPSSFVDFSKSILYSLGFSSNFYFYYSGQQYGSESGLLKPFLHTWSLSVEEQYYILFPVVLLITFKYFRKYLIHILILGFVISLSLADWGSKNYPSFNFYALPTRVWELLAGSILAYFEITGRGEGVGVRFKYKILNLILPSVGLFLIGYSILFFNDTMFHPSFYTLYPIMGVCFIIWFSNKNELITKILSTKLFVGIGLISYSLYLWHYPIFAFARVNQFIEGNFINKIMIGLVIFILSFISYYFVERFFRNKKNNFYKIFKLIFFLILIILMFIIFIIIKDGKVNKTNVFIEKYISSALYREKCKFSSNNYNFYNEIFFKKEFLNCKKKYNEFILILGDSHSRTLFNSISKISSKNEFIIGLNQGGCRPFDKNHKNCHYLNALTFINENKNNIKIILFTHKGSFFLTNYNQLPINEQLNKTINYLLEIKKINNKLLFIGPHLEPNVELNYKSILNFLNKNNFKDNTYFKDNTNFDLIEVDKKLKEVSKKNNIKYISKIDILDFKFERDFIVDNNFTFSDTNHWSEFGEVYFGRKLVFNSIIKDILFP